MADSWDDEALLAALQQAWPGPPGRAARVRRGGQERVRVAQHRRRAGPAHLRLGTATAERAAAARAEAASIRALTFTSAHLTIELEVTPDSLVGQVVPARAGDDRGPGQGRACPGRRWTRSAASRSTRSRAGPFRLHCRTAAAPTC